MYWLNRTALAASATALLAFASTAAFANGSHHRHHGWWDFRWADFLPVYLTETLDASAIDTDGDMFVGDGNSVDNFVIQRNGNVELAIKGKYRQGDDILPTFIGGDDLVHIVVPGGPQVMDPAHNVPGPNPNRAAWALDFSVSTALGGSTRELDEYEAWLYFDVDPSTKVKYLKTKLSVVPPSGKPHANNYGWKYGTIAVIDDDEGTAQVTQNSFNYAFIASYIDSNPNLPGIQPYAFSDAEFDAELMIRKKFGPELAHLHVVFNVDAP